MRYKNDQKISNLSSPDPYFSSSKCTKIRFRTPLGELTTLPGGAYDAPPDPPVGWGAEYPLPIPLDSRSTPSAPRFSGPLQCRTEEGVKGVRTPPIGV